MMHKDALYAVYSQKKYIYLSITVFSGLLFSLSLLSEFIFLSPIVTFSISSSTIVDFMLIVAISVLSGIVTSLSTYRIKTNQNSLKRSGAGFVGSIVGASAGACSCGSLGFSLASVFGTIGGTATAFLTNYEMPLRLVSIAILGYMYFISIRDITAKCKIVK